MNEFHEPLPEEENEVLPAPNIEIRAERWPLVDALVQDDPRAASFSGMDRETRLRIASILDHPEARESVIASIVRDKGGVDGREVDQYLSVLSDIISDRDAELSALLAAQEKDVEERERRREEYASRLRSLIDFFQPKAATTLERTVLLLPTNPFLKEKEGYSIPIGTTVAIQSHIRNPDNLDHEFLHAVINPITEKLDLTEDERRRIVDRASPKLRKEQGYGDDASSLLNETLLRVYTTFFTKGKRPMSEQLFKHLTRTMTDARFEASRRDERAARRLEDLGIHDLSDLRLRWREYFDRYERDDLGQEVYDLYRRYASARTHNPSMTFEDYFIEHVHDLLRN